MMVLRRTAGLGGTARGLANKPMKCFFFLLYAPLLVLSLYFIMGRRHVVAILAAMVPFPSVV
jgi:hypothetical protein